MASRYRKAFGRRVRQTVEIPGVEPREIWCARPEDVIVGKLMAWDEGRSRKHETDIYEMMVFHYLGADSALSVKLDETYVDAQARMLSEDVAELWAAVKAAACQEAERRAAE
jgi:hypothetical protein